MGSDEIMPELLRQQDPGSLGEGGWREVCHAGKAAVRSPPLQPDARLPARRESSKGRERVGMGCIQAGTACTWLVGRDLLGSVSGRWSWGHSGGAWRGGHPACAGGDRDGSAGGSGCPWERCWFWDTRK